MPAVIHKLMATQCDMMRRDPRAILTDDPKDRTLKSLEYHLHLGQLLQHSRHLVVAEG